jgi:hypothetical protein
VEKGGEIEQGEVEDRWCDSDGSSGNRVDSDDLGEDMDLNGDSHPHNESDNSYQRGKGRILLHQQLITVASRVSTFLSIHFLPPSISPRLTILFIKRPPNHHSPHLTRPRSNLI